MRPSSPALIGVLAASLALAACAPEPVSPPDTERTEATGGILTSFDRLTLARGEGASFRAAVVSGGALSTAGLSFAMRNPSVASLTAANGRARVQGLAAGRTWVVVQSAIAGDSVEIVVE
jgi:hypothetical protein